MFLVSFRVSFLNLAQASCMFLIPLVSFVNLAPSSRLHRCSMNLVWIVNRFSILFIVFYCFSSISSFCGTVRGQHYAPLGTCRPRTPAGGGWLIFCLSCRIQGGFSSPGTIRIEFYSSRATFLGLTTRNLWFLSFWMCFGLSDGPGSLPDDPWWSLNRSQIDPELRPNRS